MDRVKKLKQDLRVATGLVKNDIQADQRLALGLIHRLPSLERHRGGQSCLWAWVCSRWKVDGREKTSDPANEASGVIKQSL